MIRSFAPPFALVATVALAAPAPCFAVPTLAVRYQTVTRKKAGRYELAIRYPVFAGTTPVARLANAEISRYIAGQVATFLREEATDWRDFRRKEHTADAPLYSLGMAPTVSVARPDFISLYFDRDTYMGGAHGGYNFPSFAFGMVDGAAKRLRLGDLFTGDPYAALSKPVVPELMRRKASWFVDTDPMYKQLSKENLRDWTITPGGITLLFEPYAVGSYAEGAYIVKVPWADLGDTVNKSGALKPVFAP